MAKDSLSCLKNIIRNKEYQILYGCATALAAIIIILVFVWTDYYLGGFGWQDDPLHQFNYHPVFAVMGLIIVYGQGLLLYRTFSNLRKTTLKVLHAVIMFAAFVLSVIALKCAFDSHDKRPVQIPNMYSLHSWIGLGAVIMFSSQLCCGFLLFLYPKVRASHLYMYSKYHQFFGILIFILGVLACISGITEKINGSVGKDYKHLPAAALVPNFLGTSITIFAAIVLYLAMNNQFRRKPLPEEDQIFIELHDPLP